MKGELVQCAFEVKAEADLETRTITALAVPYGEQGFPNSSFGGAVTFAAGSISNPDGKVVVLVGHDSEKPVGLLAEAWDESNGLNVKLKIAATSRGDEVLLEAAEGIRDGVSVGVFIDDFETDPKTRVTTVTAATLREVSLVTFPAFNSARVSEVAASDNPEVSADSAAESIEEGNEEMENEVTVSAAENAAETLNASRVPMPAVKVREAFPYRPGGEFSFFADMLNAKDSAEANARFSQGREMLTAAQDSADIADIIPEGYRPDLYVGQLGIDTPLLNAFQSFSIADARPFNVPKFVSATNMVSDHVEGTNPTDGSISVDKSLITPTAVSGQYTISREAVLGSTPGIDSIVMNAIMQAVLAKREQEFADALLAGATEGGDISLTTPTASVLGEILDYQDERLADPSIAVAGSDLFRALALEVSEDGRPMNPYVGASNANGVLGANARSLSVAGFGMGKAWAIDGGLLALPTDAASWYSGLTTWRWEEVAGPANIRFAAYGIHAYAVLRAAGVRKFAMAVA